MCRSDLPGFPRRQRLLGALLVSCLSLLLRSTPATAWSADKTPAEPVPSNRWGALEPKGILGDQSGFSYHRDPKQTDPFWFAVDIENNFLFAATGRGIQVYDARTQPAEPALLGYGYGPHPTTQGMGGLMPAWQHSDEDFFLKDLDAPPGVDSMVAVAGREQGFVLWNTANKIAPVVHYQDQANNSIAVHSATIGGRHYAFSVGDAGVYLYDLSAAQQLSLCLDTSPTSLPCAGVYKGKLPGVGGGSFIDGVGSYIIVGRFFAGFEIWNVATPTAPVKVMSSNQNAALGVALWKVGSSHYAAHVDYAGKLRTFDVSCIASGPCTAPAPLATVNVPGGSAPLIYVTVSFAGTVPYLHVGGDDTFSCVVQREYLFKVSNPAAPDDITPKTHPGGYWGWYYELCADGTNWVSPIGGKFGGGEYFYRAAFGLLDVHKLAGAQPPVANFTWSPSEVYPGTAVSFSDTSSGLPNAWLWVFGDGTPGTATDKNPASITFSSPGTKAINLQAFNGAGDDSESKTLTVLDPAPVVASVGVSPASPFLCQPLTLTANGATGQPVLAFAWDVKSDATTTTVQTGNGNPFTWNIPAGLTPGSYTATVTASNGAGNASKSATFTVNGLATLPGENQFTPTNDPFAAGTVQFHVNVPGATEWNWDFEGDGFNEADWTNDPITGPNPVHSYTTTGVRQVRVKVKNCVQPQVTSAALAVDIDQITPLVANFQLGSACFGGETCFYPEDLAINFVDLSTGAEKWEYDWNGDGTYDEVSTTGPVLSHTYPTPTTTTFKPRLRVSRGASEQNFIDLVQSLKIDPAGPAPTPKITIGGPGSGLANAPLAFNAAATDCTASATGWTWNAGGGTLTGSGANVTIQWSSDGSKSISATNSGCPGVTGTKTVTIGSSQPQPQPGQLEARFTFSPVPVKAGETLTLNGSTSLGSPTTYNWTFGDGTPMVSGPEAVVTHKYANAGTFQVTLGVVNTAKACPPAPFCEHSLTKAVVVVSDTPAPVASFTTSAICSGEFGLVICNVAAGQNVSFTDTSTGTVVTRSWDFGDGQTASGAAVTHAFAPPNTYTVTLTVGNGGGTTNVSRTFVVGPAQPKKKSVVLPWIAQTRGVLVQSSDLYLHNPGGADLPVVVTFRQRGTPDPNPPTAALTIKPHETLFYGDVIKELFNKENIAGYITVVTEGDGPAPIITSFNSTRQLDGSKFGQAVSGSTLNTTTEAATLGPKLHHLVGLNANTEKLAYLGVSNPNDAPATYKLKFFDNLGRTVGESEDIVLARFGQQQFQAKALAANWGINNLDDYRVEVQAVAGGQLFPYGANVRVQSTDPSFVGGGRSNEPLVHLIGVFGTKGLNNSLWQTDVVLGNSSDQVVLTDVTFRSVGTSPPTYDTVRVTLQPRETKRIENVLNSLWGLSNTVGVLTFSSDSPSGVYPTILAEIYDNADPGKRFGQSMTARAVEAGAGPGQSQHLIGLRQDAEYRSTLSLFNPSTDYALYDLVYRELDGDVVQTVANLQLGPGKARQINPAAHPLPAGGLPSGFSVEVRVKAGKILAGGQVVNNATNDPAFIGGETR